MKVSNDKFEAEMQTNLRVLTAEESNESND